MKLKHSLTLTFFALLAGAVVVISGNAQQGKKGGIGTHKQGCDSVTRYATAICPIVEGQPPEPKCTAPDPAGPCCVIVNCP